MTIEQQTLEVKICRACHKHQEHDKLISDRLAKYNLNLVIAKKSLCEVCKGVKDYENITDS